MSSSTPHDDPLMRLRTMLDAAREAVALASRKQRPDLDTNRQLSLALVQLLVAVSDAASRTPLDERAQYPQVLWDKFVGLRNRLGHVGDSVNLDLVWKTVKNDLPPLIRELEQIISSDWD